MPGIIYLVATPIGNLGDMSKRAIEILNSVDFIAAEDTRHSLRLLNHFDIKKSLVSYHEHNKRDRGEKIISEVLEGKSVAVVTDAGTPGISDPGSDLVKLAIENGIEVYSIPGPAAFLYALIVSGLDTDKFVFEGFLDREKGRRVERLNFLANDERTMIFYEAPHRLKKTLADLSEIFGEKRRIAVCRELTKLHEEILRMSLGDTVLYFNETEPKGEYVLVVEGKSLEEIKNEKEMEFSSLTIEEHIKMHIEKGFTKKEAIKMVATDRGLPKSEVYKYSIDL